MKTRFSDFTDDEFGFILSSVSRNIIAITHFTNKRKPHQKLILDELGNEMQNRPKYAKELTSPNATRGMQNP